MRWLIAGELVTLYVLFFPNAERRILVDILLKYPEWISRTSAVSTFILVWPLVLFALLTNLLRGRE